MVAEKWRVSAEWTAAVRTNDWSVLQLADSPLEEIRNACSMRSVRSS